MNGERVKHSNAYGHVAQWLEHLSDEEEVGSSILPLPTSGSYEQRNNDALMRRESVWP